MIKKLVILIFSCLLLIGCEEAKVKVGVMTLLTTGAIPSISTWDNVMNLSELNDMSNIEFIPLDDGGTLTMLEEAFNQVLQEDIHIIVTAHTSTLGLRLQELIDESGEEILVLNTASTTPELSNLDDNFIRVIQDVQKEQESISNAIKTKRFNNLLIIRDVEENYAYTGPALDYFLSSYDRQYTLIDVMINDIDVDALGKQLTEIDYDVLYLLIGGYQTKAGGLAQIAASYNPDILIYYTPWMKTSNILSTASGTINQSIFPSHYPIIGANLKLDKYILDFETKYGYTPIEISLNVCKLIDILEQAVDDGNYTVKEIKKFIQTKRNFETQLGYVEFNEYLDSDSDLFFIENINDYFK